MKNSRYLLLIIILLSGLTLSACLPGLGQKTQEVPTNEPTTQTPGAEGDMIAPAPKGIILDEGMDESADGQTTMYTLAQVATHKTASDCWLVIEGDVYDVTEFVARHPGGQAIVSGCGQDATVGFNSRPQGSGTPHSEAARRTLAQFKIGQLQTE